VADQEQAIGQGIQPGGIQVQEHAGAVALPAALAQLTYWRDRGPVQ
jgi:hypothetical protein